MEDKIKNNYAMEISDEYKMFQNCSVSIKNLDDHIYHTISSAYAYNPGSLHKQCNSNFDKDFVNYLSLRGDTSKMSASIVSCNLLSEDYDIFQSPSVTTITDIESNI